jgi:2-oxoglutarate dehydrogenase E2 component (dihydrolipoamide succinyltransferase)
MGELKVELPKMGESVAEATITTWLKSVGDNIEEDEPIVEIATDKVDSEVPSPCSGTLKEILFNEGDVVEVGSTFAIIETEGAVDLKNESNVPAKEETSEVNIESEILKPLDISNETKIISNGSDRFYSPLVKSIAQKEGITQNDLENINGSGANGRVTKKDIINFLENKTKKSN